MAYPWPGNVRELRNVIERMIVLAAGPRLTVLELTPAIRARAGEGRAALPVGGSLREASRQMIIAALEACGGNRAAAARQLGISRRTLHRKLREYGLPMKRVPRAAAPPGPDPAAHP